MSDGSPATNPFNDLPTVRLLDQGGAEMRLVSQREAGRLLRVGQAELLLETPPAVRLVIPTAEHEALAAGEPGPDGVKAQFLHARRGLLYGNFHFQGPDGQTMFHGDSEKALWYLNRGLVEVVSRSPPVLRFRFAPGGPGHAGDDYYLTGKVNRCVVCGAVEGLNRHHVIPSVYRRHLPTVVKDHSHHDVLLLCLACHEKYEAAADELKAELGAEVGVPLHGLRSERDPERNQAIKSAIALVRHGKHIPEARKEELRQAIGAWTGRWPVSDADVVEVAVLGLDEKGEVIEHGQRVVEQTADMQGFVRRWREHFLRTMRPRFLPAHWDVDRPARRGQRDTDEAATG
jgi:hypothetical protein